jgi:uncharacterized iron-regulated membrane protein
MTLRVRPLLRQIHLWLGLALGGLFVLLGLTGAALVFYIEIDAALHPAAREAASGPAPGWDSPVWDRALVTARARWTDPHGTWSFEATGQGGTIPARYYPSDHHSHHAEREMVWFSADGHRIVRAEPWGDYLMSWLYELHMHLLAGEMGSQIVGWSGFAMLLLLVSGVIVWWPRGSWRKALAFKRHAVPLRRLRDWHKLSGLWSMLLLFVLVATGALLALPSIKTQLLSATIATPDKVPSPSSGAESGQQIPVSQALIAAHRALPDARLAFVDVPGAGAEPFKMRVQVPGDPHHRFPASFVFVDQYSGRVLAVHDIRRGNAATTVSAWVRTLHDGSVGGLATRILAIVLGFVPLLLFLTGFFHWRRRLAARAKSTSTGGIS